LTSPSTSTVEHFFGQPSELQSPWSTTTPSPSSTFPPTIPMTTTHQQIPQQTPSHASVCVCAFACKKSAVENASFSNAKVANTGYAV
jgi:hypothetical protein